jgi:hypothetical protein
MTANENVSDIGVLCQELGHRDFSATVSEFLAQLSSPGDRTCREMAARMRNQCPPSAKKGRQFDMPDGIIADPTRECGGNVHHRHVVDVTYGSSEEETYGTNPHSRAFENDRS